MFLVELIHKELAQLIVIIEAQELQGLLFEHPKVVVRSLVVIPD